jgi:AcrR family transcriptional regulator
MKRSLPSRPRTMLTPRGPSTALSPRARIVAAARRHYLAQGFRGVTMDDLARELCMSKRTLYTHFASKTDLLEAILLDKLGEIEADLERIASSGQADFLIGLRHLLACVQGHTAEIQPPFLRDLQRESPELFRIVETRRREIVRRYFGKLLRRGRSQGLIRKDIPLTLIIEILLGAVEAIMNPPKMNELGLTPKAGFIAILSIVLEGAITRKGRARR